MYYASFGILAVILHIIINNKILRKRIDRTTEASYYRYKQFLISILVFYIADILWGFFDDAKNQMLLYADTWLFFAVMALSVLLWTRFVIAYLGKSGILSKAFGTAGWVIFGFVILLLIINFFNPVIFNVTEEAEYIPGFGRYIILVVQFLLFILISVYSLFVSTKSTGTDRIHYGAICVSGGVMAILIVLQTFNPFAPFYTIGCLVANCIVHVFIEEDQKKELFKMTAEARREKEHYSQISYSLAKDYEAIYYINIETGKYMVVSASEAYKSANVPLDGDDFYKESLENVSRLAHPDDRSFAESMCHRETIEENLKDRKSYTYKYRIMTEGEVRYFQFDAMLSDDEKHFVVCFKDIQDIITAETERIKKQKTQITFSRIAESLASNYDVIYYIDVETDEYSGYTARDIYGGIKVEDSGKDFFTEAAKNVELIIHPKDRERVRDSLSKDTLIERLEEKKQFSIEYRQMLLDGTVHNLRFTARKSSDERHLIICVENIDDEVKKEKEHEKELNTVKELARRDELTGTRNKTAFAELEESVQENIDKGMDCLPFAIVVCDLNNLKKINDTMGHNAGDEYIKESAKLLCDEFKHSPVYRIGGDEFAVFLRGQDFTKRKDLVDDLHKKVIENLNKHEGPVIAVGMADFDPRKDLSVDEIFERADHLMYENKQELKSRS